MSRTILRSSPKPSLSGQVASFRKALGLNQEEFAKALGVKRLAVLMWEKEGKGGYEPSIESLLRLAKLARNAVTRKPLEATRFRSYARWFWERVGIDDSALRVLVPELKESFRKYEQRIGERPKAIGKEFVQLPFIDEDFSGWDHESLLSRIHSQIRDGVETYVPFPSFSIPTPRATVCIAVPDPYMRPIFNEGDLVAVDVSFADIVTVDSAKEFFNRFGLSRFGGRSLVAAYYNRPDKPPRYNGRDGIHIRAVTFVEGKMHLYSEMGTNTAALAKSLAALKESERKEFERTLLGNLGNRSRVVAKEELSLEQEFHEMSDLVIPDDPGVSILGKVVAWIGSSRAPELKSPKDVNGKK
jgi:transcriptional regulator with XRE-family HTH domain